MFKSYGFIIKTKKLIGNQETITERYCPEMALTYISVDEIGQSIYFVNDNTVTTFKKDELQQVVGIWESEDVLLLKLDIIGE